MSKCIFCGQVEHSPKYMQSLKFKEDHNLWDELEDFLKVYALMKEGKWGWGRNTAAKYVNLRIDMRDGGCIISTEGKRISPKQLAWQYSKETPRCPTDEEAYREEEK